MNLDEPLQSVLASYPADLQPRRFESLAGAGGFSGARIWWLDTPRGPACLRRWAPEHPSRDRLEFIQAVLWHVDQEGFHLVPVPYETLTHSGYVCYDEHLWELTPWMPGSADYHCLPCPRKLKAALSALAGFHRSAENFPLPETAQTRSPGLCERRERLLRLCNGGVCRIENEIASGDWPELALRGRRICELFHAAARKVLQLVEHACQLHVPLQPCIRDVWHDHILFEGSNVSAIIDFGAMRPECVAADIARLLGSMVHDDLVGWHVGMSAYQSTRPLSDAESQLVMAFDRTSVLMSGIQWLEWIYCQGRQFEDREAVLARIDDNTSRLMVLADS